MAKTTKFRSTRRKKKIFHGNRFTPREADAYGNSPVVNPQLQSISSDTPSVLSDGAPLSFTAPQPLHMNRRPNPRQLIQFFLLLKESYPLI